MLDTPTANNGKFTPLMIYNQDEALPYMPPRVYLTPAQVTYVQQNFTALSVVTDSTGSYVQILPVNTGDLFNQWAVMPMGTCPLDQAYWALYAYIPRTDASPGNFLAGNSPGYWNYYGDLSVSLQDVTVTGVQTPNTNGGANTWTTSNATPGVCPQVVIDLLGSSLSFNQDFFNSSSRSTAVFCDVDSEGQTCTQIFCGKAGIYKMDNGVPRTFFTGTPCKSTANWMNLSKVINWSDMAVVPMGGSASFYATIPLANCDPALQSLLNQYAGQTVTSLFMSQHKTSTKYSCIDIWF